MLARRARGGFMLAGLLLLLVCGAPRARAATVFHRLRTAQAGDCAALATQDFSSLPAVSLVITGATDVAATATAPASCQVSGTIANSSQFVLQLPSSGWTGQYFESGCGGLCGMLNPDADCQMAFSQGAAIGYSDLGHESASPGASDNSWALNEGSRLDFAYEANHELAVAAKAAIAAYYGRPPTYSYFDGCSDGGREALMEAQRFPDDFDGIVAGAPAYLLAFLNSFKHTWQYRALYDSQGNAIFTTAKATLLHNAVIAACQGQDGVQDGLIIDPRGCSFDPGTLLCPNNVDADSCLTQQQVDAAKMAYSSPVDANGVAYYPGGVLPYGSELHWAGGGAGPMGGGSMDQGIVNDYLENLAFPLAVQGASVTADTLTFDPASYQSLLPMSEVYDASNTDLSAFRDHGGKLILYHGWSDDSISPYGTIAYYTALEQQMGGPGATQQFARLFMFPGVYHCSGGYGPSHWDMVTAITDWVERGVAPDEIVATQYDSDTASAGGGFANPTQGGGQASGTVVRTLPAFPYPLAPQYTGSGDANDAANYAPVPSPYTANDNPDWIGRDQLSPMQGVQ